MTLRRPARCVRPNHGWPSISASDSPVEGSRSGSAASPVRAVPCWPPGSRRNRPQRLLTIISTTPADAERWLSDLQHLTDVPIALYPQREALGEEEPHYEIAGERVETIAALLEGRLRILVTTARATLERTRVPASLAEKTLRLRTGATDAAVRHAASLSPKSPLRSKRWVTAGSRRSPRWPSSASGAASSTCTASGWRPRPASNGGVISSSRSGLSTSPRSARARRLDEITILPMAWCRPREAGTCDEYRADPEQRQTLLELLPAGTLVIEEASGANGEEVSRAWREAEHHLVVARRLGEEVPAREEIFEAPDRWQGWPP